MLMQTAGNRKAAGMLRIKVWFNAVLSNQKQETAKWKYISHEMSSAACLAALLMLKWERSLLIFFFFFFFFFNERTELFTAGTSVLSKASRNHYKETR